MIYDILNFGMTMFAIYMIEKMSRAIWSNNDNDIEGAKKTT